MSSALSAEAREQRAASYKEGIDAVEAVLYSLRALKELFDDGACLEELRLSEEGQLGLAALFGILSMAGFDGVEKMPFAHEFRALLGLEPGKEVEAHE